MRVLRWVLVALVLGVTPTAAGNFTVCRDPDWPQLRFLAYPASEIYQYDFSPKPQVGGGIYGKFLVADGIWTGKTGVQINGVWHYVDWNTQYCDFTPDEPDPWRPGAPSIPVAMTTDCAFVEIRDEYNHWHLVLSNGEPVLLHYGEMLIGGHHQSLNPADYRAVPAACY